ncbi:MAG TPA: mechanosensitive ion channel domain-containing protein [Stellaceae bacterium]|nr:mechanosensitive ion channel domain-containing protein [Stellaceae bacterium]
MPNPPRLLGLAAAILLVLALGAGVARAAGETPAPAPAKPETVSIAELQRLVDTLESDKDRARLVEDLKALIAAERAKQQAAPPSPRGFLEMLSAELRQVGDEVLATLAAVADAPRIADWFEGQMSDPVARARWVEVATHLGIVFGLAALANLAVGMLLRRPRAALARNLGARPWSRLGLALLRALLDLLPILAFAAAGYLVLPLLQPRLGTSQVAEIMIDASVLARALVTLARGLLLDAGAPAGLLGLEEESRTYLYVWARRFVAWSVYGYAVLDGALWLGIPEGIDATLARLVALVLAALTVVFVLQNRHVVGAWLRGAGEVPPKARGFGAWRLLRQRLADTWHVLAIVYVVGIYAVYALRIPGGIAFALRASGLSVVLIVGAGLLVRLVGHAAERGFALSPDQKARFPTLEARANRYLPVFSAAVSAAVYFFAGLALLQAWGADGFGWMQSGWGQRVTGAAVSIGVVGLVAIAVWEVFGSAIEHYLAAVDVEGRPLPRTARTRTLLPLLRTAMLVVLALTVGLTVLSELGVNIAPLLAGAGIVGIAIGFGSQALVKDIITGLFILVEDTLAIGDVVDVGGDHAGVVEAISIRAIKLRDMAGTVHTVPFGAVTSVKNLTRDYSYYVADIAISWDEDTDEVIDLLKEVARALKEDPAFGYFMLEPLEVVGVDRFADASVIIKVRLKTVPLQQWSVGREFNRRVKKAFDAEGIETSSPQRVVYSQEPPPKA